MKIIISFAAFILSLVSIKAQAYQERDSVIISTDNPKGWIIHTKSSAYQLVIAKEGNVLEVYYGPSEQAAFKKKNTTSSKGVFVGKAPLTGISSAPLIQEVFFFLKAACSDGP